MHSYSHHLHHTTELIALDDKGNVLCFNRHGKELWETRISGFASQAATFGDVDGDGMMDVVVGTVPGHVWALRGKDGRVVPNFPIKTNGEGCHAHDVNVWHSRVDVM